MSYHAKLSPSSAHRWMHCPASVRLSEDVPKETSAYAEAGTLAHSLAELKARKRFFPMSARTYSSQQKKLEASEHYAPEMAGYTDRYAEVLDEHALSFPSEPFTALEVQVPVGQYTGEYKPDGTPATGQADCIQIGGDTLWVTDYKNGAGVPVDAKGNPQLMLYGLGALTLYALIYGDSIQRVKLTIVQPALKSVSDWEISRSALERWGLESVRPAAKEALGENPPAPSAGDWCRFCPVRAKCRANSDHSAALAFRPQTAPDLLTDAEIGERLALCRRLKPYITVLEDYAREAILNGGEIPGWKLVEGRSSRIWTAGAFDKLTAAGIDEALLYERKPLTPPQLEKALGGAVYRETVEPLVEKKPGAPTLAEESDTREPYNPAEVSFQAMQNGP